jgi:hypothetical protein
VKTCHNYNQGEREFQNTLHPATCLETLRDRVVLCRVAAKK